VRKGIVFFRIEIFLRCVSMSNKKKGEKKKKRKRKKTELGQGAKLDLGLLPGCRLNMG